MYKVNSENLQFRARNKIDFPVLDESIFKDRLLINEKKSELILEKRRLEVQLFGVRQEHSSIASLARSKGIYAPPSKMNSLRDMRERLVAQILSIDEQLKLLKDAVRKEEFIRQEAQDRDFPRAFLKMAKQMLADDAFHRIAAAASHAVAEVESPAA